MLRVQASPKTLSSRESSRDTRRLSVGPSATLRRGTGGRVHRRVWSI